MSILQEIFVLCEQNPNADITYPSGVDLVGPPEHLYVTGLGVQKVFGLRYQALQMHGLYLSFLGQVCRTEADAFTAVCGQERCGVRLRGVRSPAVRFQVER